jgi:hypothetical protein
MWPVLYADATPREEPPVYVVSPPPPEAAPPEPRDETTPEHPAPYELHDGGFELTLATTVFRPDLRNVVFDGSGVPIQGDNRVAFQRKGREMGIAQPLFWGGSLSVHYTRRWFALGLEGFLAGHPGGADAKPTPIHEASTVGEGDASGLMAYGAAIDLAGAIPFDEHVAVRVGPTLGLRGFSLPISGFQPATCHSRRGDYPCAERATADPQLFAEPRVRIELDPVANGGLFLGAYAGWDIVNTSWSGGLLLGFHTAHAMLLP